MSVLKEEESSDKGALLWSINSKPDNPSSFIYALQWFGLSIVQIGVVALIVGPYLGLDQSGIAALGQRLFFLSGLVTLLQVTLGHKLPAIEGPASQWWVTFICLADVGLGLGRPISEIRTDLMGALCVSGSLLLLIGSSGILKKLEKYFTPAFVGCALILLALQTSETFITGILGITEKNPQVDTAALISSLISIAVVIYISYSRFPFMRSINLLVGLIAGWSVHVILNRQPLIEEAGLPCFFKYPLLFQWGMPSFNVSAVTAGVMITIMLVSANIASITAMSRAVGINMDERRLNRSLVCNGVGNLLAGFGSSVGDVPLTSSVGVVKLSGVASRKPVIIYSLILISIGFSPGVGELLAGIPRPVGYAVMMASYTQILLAGLQNVRKMGLTQKDSYVLGVSIIAGAGLMGLSPIALGNLPVVFQYVFGQGMFAGLVICILLEHLFLRNRR